MSNVTLKIPALGPTYVEIDGVQYPVTAGQITVPIRHYSMLLDNGYTDPRESPTGVWDDVQGDISEGTGTAALTYEAYRDTGMFLRFLQHNQADALHMRFQMPHSFDVTKPVKPHLHYVPMVNPATPQVFGVKGEWAWADYGQVIPAASGWTAFAATATIATDDAFKSKILSLGEVAPTANAAPSSILLVRLYRDSGATDTYTTNKVGGTSFANIGVLACDVHFQKSRQGTASEFA